MAILLGIAIVGCDSKRTATTTTGTGVLISAPSQLSPEALPGAKADLVLAGVRRGVDLRKRSSGDLIRIDTLVHGGVVESETYMTGTDLFRLVSAADEQYVPAIPLLKFPMHVGDAWSWEGNISSGGTSRAASATITTSAEQRFEGAQAAETVRVAVALSISASTTAPAAQRRLQFWFAPGHGIVRREFGPASIREAPAQSTR